MAISFRRCAAQAWHFSPVVDFYSNLRIVDLLSAGQAAPMYQVVSSSEVASDEE